MNGWIHVWWMGELMDDEMDSWMDGWIVGRMDRCMDG